MLACVGYIVPEYFRWPGYLSPEKARTAHCCAVLEGLPYEHECGRLVSHLEPQKAYSTSFCVLQLLVANGSGKRLFL